MRRIASLKGSITELQKVCLSRNIAFVTFCTPGSKDIQTLIQYKSSPGTISSLSQINFQQGFVFAPFAENRKFPVFLVKPDFIINGYAVDRNILEKLKEADGSDKGINSANDTIYESSKDEFLGQAELIKVGIHSGALEKAVLSRVRLVENKGVSDVPDIFNKIIHKYPQAFRYMLNIPGAGTWTGATPELLVEVNDNVIGTVSMAGTQKLKGIPAGKVEWQIKEKDEQKFVTKFIENHLKDFGITDYIKKGPFNQPAANLVHLKSTFSFSRSSLKEGLGKFISALHPTPSVCGSPKEEASQFIRQLEKHEREYFTGFLGPLNIAGRSNLFVNIRCMRVLQHQFALFAGAGITSGSDVGNEWKETEFKMQTLLSVMYNTKTDHD